MAIFADLVVPSPPLAALRLIELCGSESADIAEIQAVIATDAALAVRLLKAANSAHYGQQYEVATLSRAVVVLGAEQVKSVALGFQLAGWSQRWTGLPIELRSFWQGNVLRACLARRIALASGVTAPGWQSEAFLVGLLQDVCVPVIAAAVGPAYASWPCGQGLYTTSGRLVLEQRATGEDHAALVGRSCQEWRIPERLTEAVRKHHREPPAHEADQPVDVLWQIAYFVGAIPFNGDCATAPVVSSLLELSSVAFGLSAPDLGACFYRAVEDYASLQPVFDGLLATDDDAATLMELARRLVVGAAEGEDPGFSP